MATVDQEPSRSEPDAVTKHDVARSAGVASLSRLGALIELVSQPAFTWLFGVATYGVYTVLWAAVNIVSNVVDLAMTTALQRVVPSADSETRAHSALKLALIVGVLPSLLIALGATLAARPLAALVNAAPEDQSSLVLAIALFAWALPLWTFVEVATSAIRARRAFGPEIRLRIFWEQVARLGFALVAFAVGLHSLGLIVAHLASLTVTALLSVRLIGRHFDLGLLVRAPLDRIVLGDLLRTGFAILPSNIIRRLFSDLPAVLLNLMLAGAAGATAAGLYGIARKVASVPQVVRQTFAYVMAPLASAQAAVDRSAIQPLYAFSTRLSTVLVVPLAVALCALGEEILRLFAPEARAALPLLVVLTIARALEAFAGPAASIIEMIGHRLLLILNAVAGLLVWLLFAALLVPRFGGTGMAVAVGIGIVLMSYLALIELHLGDGLNPFSGRYWLGLAISLLTSGAMFGIERLVAPLGPAARALTVALLFPVTMWLGLRFGLSRSDREALGSIGRRLRLAKVTVTS